MRRQPTRTAYDPYQDNLEGLLSDPDRHIPPGSADTVHDLARAAINAAFELPKISGQFDLGQQMFTTAPRGSASRQGADIAERALEQERRDIIDAKLGISAHPHSADIAREIAKAQGEINDRSGKIGPMQSRVAALQAARLAPGANPMETEEEINLRQQIALYTDRIGALNREITKARETEAPTTDPFTAAKLLQERDRLDGHQPTGREARGHELGGGVRGFFSNPHTVADSWRARRRAKDEQGLTGKQQRMSDRARLSRGDTPIHGTGTERPLLDKIPGKKSKERKDDRKSTETTYSHIARVGTVIRMSGGELLVVQDVQPEVAYITAPDGSEQVITYPDGTPVVMDDLADLLLRSTGAKPALQRLVGYDPVSSLPITEPVDVDSPALLESVHKGEEWVTLGQLYTREDAEEKLLEGVEDWEIAPVCIRLDDLVFGLNGDPTDRAQVLSEGNRKKVLNTHVVWQRTEHKPGEPNPPVAAIEASIPIFDGHDGHFVVPFTYPEQRRETYMAQVQASRASAARSARDTESRPPKNGIRDDRKPYFRGPSRKP